MQVLLELPENIQSLSLEKQKDEVLKAYQALQPKLDSPKKTLDPKKSRWSRMLKELVRNCAEMLGIELLYLPAYSPHLNLIERFWKFVKKQCLYSKYYEIFPEFKQAIEQCLEEANSRRQQKLESLLTWNFQSFKYVNKSPVLSIVGRR